MALRGIETPEVGALTNPKHKFPPTYLRFNWPLGVLKRFPLLLFRILGPDREI